MDHIIEFIAILISSVAVGVTLWINKKNREHAEKMIELNKQHEREMLEISFLLPKIVEIIEGINENIKGKNIDDLSGSSLRDLFIEVSDYLKLKKEPIISMGFEKEYNDFISKFDIGIKRDINVCKKSFKILKSKLNDKYRQLLRK